MDTVETLEKAADLISERGWWSAERYNPHTSIGATCAALAINDASWSSGDSPGIVALSHFLGSRPDELSCFDHVTSWNDSQTNGETVIQTLRDCALNLRFNHKEDSNV